MGQGFAGGLAGLCLVGLWRRLSGAIRKTHRRRGWLGRPASAAPPKQRSSAEGRLRHQRRRPVLEHRREGQRRRGQGVQRRRRRSSKPAEGVTDQNGMVEDLLTGGIDGIAISPIDAKNQAPLINKAAAEDEGHHPRLRRAGEQPAACTSAWTTTRPAGMCGKLVKEAMPSGGKVMIFVGRLEQDNAASGARG